jgi:hypothetical protein
MEEQLKIEYNSLHMRVIREPGRRKPSRIERVEKSREVRKLPCRPQKIPCHSIHSLPIVHREFAASCGDNCRK